MIWPLECTPIQKNTERDLRSHRHDRPGCVLSQEMTYHLTCLQQRRVQELRRGSCEPGCGLGLRKRVGLSKMIELIFQGRPAKVPLNYRHFRRLLDPYNFPATPAAMFWWFENDDSGDLSPVPPAFSTCRLVDDNNHSSGIATTTLQHHEAC